MTPATRLPTNTEILYPESDGKPAADNTKQWRWMVVLFNGLCAMFCDRDDVFIASNLLWYPGEGHPEISAAPDVFVAFGRPKGDRGSYKQWLEGNVAPQIVFEILSPGNDAMEMSDKLAFYTEREVEEYYLFDPDQNRLAIFVRKGTALRRQWGVQEWVSPLMKIRFDLRGPEMTVHEPGPTGQRFRTYEEIRTELDTERQRATEAERRMTEAEQRTARLIQQLRDAGITPES